MPFDGNRDEIIYCDSVCEANSISFFWNLPQDKYDYQKKQSLNLILSLLTNQSEGGIYNCLQNLNYASDLCSDDVASISTAFKCINFEITLTEDGI